MGIEHQSCVLWVDEIEKALSAMGDRSGVSQMMMERNLAEKITRR
ncbi:MAG: hypothetical protein V7K77_14300 [Nostoc sp.]